jgi:hypothetical protein
MDHLFEKDMVFEINYEHHVYHLTKKNIHIDNELMLWT